MSMTVIAVAVVDRGGSYVIGLRPEGVPLAGYWEFPGGKVLPNEGPAAAAARECLEETGMRIDVGPRLLVVQHEYPHGTVELHFFDCTAIDSGAEPQPPFKWAKGSTLGSYRFPAANAALLELLAGDPH